MPRRPLIVVTTAVLLVHGWLLLNLPLAHSVVASTAGGGVVFETRSVPNVPMTLAVATPPVSAPPETSSPVIEKPKPPQPAKPAPRPEPDTIATRAISPSEAAAPEQAHADALEKHEPADAHAEAAASTTETVALAETAEPPHATQPPAGAPENNTATAAAPWSIRLPGAHSELVTNLPAVLIPSSIRMNFDVSGEAKGFHYSATAELEWQHDGQHYQARQEVKVIFLGTRAQTSVGRITAYGLQPERFGDKARREQAAHFDFAKGIATFSANTPNAPIGPGTQDRLSLFIQLGSVIAAEPGRFVPGTQININNVSAKSAELWTMEMQAPEVLDLPIGQVETVKLLRMPRAPYDQKAELWLSPKVGYMPVRIRLTQSNGDFVDLKLSKTNQP